jgi:predicted nucleic acid-binding protein
VITAVDTNVLLDLFGADPHYGPASREALRSCREQGGLIACDAVWAEVSAAFPTTTQARSAMDRLGVQYVPLDLAGAAGTGQAWRAYRSNGGTRQRVISDFLIGAHAASHADRLLTRDRGFYRRYFDDLTILDPTA